MILLSGFLEVLLRAVVLLGMVSAVGGVVFVLAVLLPLESYTPFCRVALNRAVKLVASGSAVLGIAQVLVLLIEPWALADDFGRWPVLQFLSTAFAHAGLVHALMGFALAISAALTLRHLHSRWCPYVLAVAAALLLASGAWLVHAVSRLEHAGLLMTVTVIHQLGAAIWAGGVLHLMVLWHTTQNSPEKRAVWPLLVSRFSKLAVLAIGIIIAAGIYLSYEYIGNFRGLIGTAYGSMVLTKAALLSFALLLGGLNFLNIRRWRQKGDRSGVFKRVPVFAESEVVIAIIIILGAAALTSQPPSVDILSQSASPAETVRVFSPRMPQLTPPPHHQMLSGAASSFDPFGIPGKLDLVQSNFNHNVSGIFVLVIGFIALLNSATTLRFARHWPLLFLPFAVFLLIVAEPNGWPLGPEGFWETLIVPGVLQHRLATFFVIGLAVFEWRVQDRGLARKDDRLAFVFPFLCVAGGALLLTHSHSAFSVKQLFLIEVSHNAIAFLAVMMGVGRLLELRLPKSANLLPGLFWNACMILIGFILLFYREM